VNFDRISCGTMPDMQKQAITKEKIRELLAENGYVPDPEGYAGLTLFENGEALWIDVNALAVRQGPDEGEVPSYPIRILFQKFQIDESTMDYVLAYVRELTKDEAKTSQAESRQPDQKKKYGPWKP
jgi:hypothetical protein